MKKRIIASNPLSQNLAKYLKLNPEDPREYLKTINSIAKEMTQRGTKMTGTTIDNWIQAREDDLSRSKKWPSLELLIPVSKFLGINYRELFIPDNYLKYSDLVPSLRRILIEFIHDIDEKHLEGLREAMIGVTRIQIDKIEKEKQQESCKYKRLLNLLEVPN